MSNSEVEIALKLCLSRITAAINEAQTIARSSACCSEAGDIERAFQIALDVEPLLFDADKLLQAAGTLRRSMPRD
jgi:hypothetical protein